MFLTTVVDKGFFSVRTSFRTCPVNPPFVACYPSRSRWYWRRLKPHMHVKVCNSHYVRRLPLTADRHNCVVHVFITDVGRAKHELDLGSYKAQSLSRRIAREG